MSFIDNIRNELEAEKSSRKIYRKVLENLPEGRLITKCRSNSRCEHYLYSSPSEPVRYLGEKDSLLISQLRQKKSYESGIKALNNNIPLLEHVIRKYIPYESQSDPRMYASQNNFKNEELVYLTTAGIYVRSKSEAFIIDVLWQRRVPFYYEKRLVLLDENGKKVALYPDITIPVSGKELLLWEHNGMLKNESYRQRNNRKMELYFLNGFYQPKNLIVTADGPNGEFSIPDIYRVVDGLILPLL